MTPEEYERKRAEGMKFQAYQFGEIDRNRRIIDEMRKDRLVQKRIMIIAAVSAVAAVLAAIFSFITVFR